ncbi:unnamed protein product [Dovyalis caffra]|uniref:Uncharacterized protein n=1 Tax=Dovyalis caffra TaxID=77055 RepID=A0AAV1RZI9_9ROSI|nr:unnamed protein product [Dovyalis caffra]
MAIVPMIPCLFVFMLIHGLTSQHTSYTADASSRLITDKSQAVSHMNWNFPKLKAATYPQGKMPSNDKHAQEMLQGFKVKELALDNPRGKGMVKIDYDKHLSAEGKMELARRLGRQIPSPPPPIINRFVQWKTPPTYQWTSPPPQI